MHSEHHCVLFIIYRFALTPTECSGYMNDADFAAAIEKDTFYFCQQSRLRLRLWLRLQPLA